MICSVLCNLYSIYVQILVIFPGFQRYGYVRYTFTCNLGQKIVWWTYMRDVRNVMKKI